LRKLGKYGDERKNQNFQKKVDDFLKKTNPNEINYITITSTGYIKRVRPAPTDSKKRGVWVQGMRPKKRMKVPTRNRQHS
jgi:hypothetical protein